MAFEFEVLLGAGEPLRRYGFPEADIQLLQKFTTVMQAMQPPAQGGPP